MVKHIDSDSDYEKLEKKGYMVVKLGAEWCGPCKRIAPFFEKLSEKDEYKDITFVSIDVDDCEDTAENLKVLSIPLFVLLKDGKEEVRLTGAGKKDLIRLLEIVGK